MADLDLREETEDIDEDALRKRLTAALRDGHARIESVLMRPDQLARFRGAVVNKDRLANVGTKTAYDSPWGRLTLETGE